jgi:hypothetical protein
MRRGTSGGSSLPRRWFGRGAAVAHFENDFHIVIQTITVQSPANEEKR